MKKSSRNPVVFAFCLALLVCLTGVAGCSGNTLENCPIADKQFYLIGGESSSPQQDDKYIPTVRQFFDTFSRMLSHKAKMDVIWKKEKGGFYIFTVTIQDTGSGKKETFKMGMTITEKGNASFSDFWGVDGKQYPVMGIAHQFTLPYKTAFDNNKKENK